MRAYEIFTEGPLSTKTFSDYSYRGDRWTNFLARLDRSDGKGGKFQIVGGGTVTIDHVPEIVRDLELPQPQWPRGRKKDGSPTVGIAFPINGTWENRIKNEDGTIDYSEVKYIALGSLWKTEEFGSTGGEKQVGDETKQLNVLNTLWAERLEAAGLELGQEMEVVIGDRKVNAAFFISTPKQCGGDCKSDWTVLDGSMNPIAWISHKKYKEGKTKENYDHAGDFFGWGGMSDKLMKNIYAKNDDIRKEIEVFAMDVKKAYPGESEGDHPGYYTTYVTIKGESVKRISSLPKVNKNTGDIDSHGTGLWVYRKITNGLIRAYAVYGVGFGKGNPRGLQNVDLVLQGVPSFTNDTTPRLMASGGNHSNGEKPDRLEDGYEPVLVAMYKPSRNDFSRLGLKGIRFSIFAMAGVTQRPGASNGTVQEI